MFNKIRRIAKSPMNVILMCSLIMSFSCKDSYTRTPQVNYSGQDLFDGIIFGIGPVAKQLPTAASITKVDDLMGQQDAVYKEFLAIKDLMLSTMNEDNNNFFNEFKKGIQSGDHIIIQETLNLSSAKYHDAMIKISGLSDDQLNKTANALVTKYRLLDQEGKYSTENFKNALRALNTDPKNFGGKDACVAFALIVVVIVAIALAQVYAEVVRFSRTVIMFSKVTGFFLIEVAL